MLTSPISSSFCLTLSPGVSQGLCWNSVIVEVRFLRCLYQNHLESSLKGRFLGPALRNSEYLNV